MKVKMCSCADNCGCVHFGGTVAEATAKAAAANRTYDVQTK